MKVFLKMLTFVVLLSTIFISCSDKATYADLLKSEKSLIADYIERNHIKIITELPADSVFPWPENTYYLSKTGLYFRLVEQGEVIDSMRIEASNKVIPRYYQYTLAAEPDTVSDWNTVDFAFPTEFIYGDATEACVAWHEAAKYMGYNNSIARLIVPSKLGFKSDEESVTPYGYYFKIKFQK